MAEIYSVAQTTASPPAAAPSGDIIINAENLSKQFGTEFAVRDLTFQVERGKIIGLIGPSGCGKTTTVRLLTGIYHPTSGSASVMGSAPGHFNTALRQRMGYMPQLFVLYPDLSVWENMNFAASLYGLSFFRRGKLIQQLLDFVELGKDRYKLARNISGGMQRRLSLAATLIHNPELIFLDEPTAGIDPILRRKFWDHFKELQDQGRTLLITTQYVNEAAYCDYVGVMNDGQLLMLETPDNLRRITFGGDVLDINLEKRPDWSTIEQIQQLPFVLKRATFDGTSLRLVVNEAKSDLPTLLSWLEQNNIPVSSAEEYLPPFDDIFVTVVEEARRAQGRDA